MKPYVFFIVVSVAVLAVVSAGCSRQAAAEGSTVIVTLPSADVNAGRQAFVDLKCYSCHRVRSEPTFPPPVSGSVGPEFNAPVANQHFSYLATAIVSPSHRLSSDMSPEVRTHMQGVLSPMADYSHVMTVRQLADLHAYLQALERK